MFNVKCLHSSLKSPDGDGWHDVRGVGLGGDVVLLLLSLVVSDDETCGARAREVGDDGGAHCHDEVAEECFPVDFFHKPCAFLF